MKILSLAHAVPSRQVTNEDLLERFACRNEGIVSRGQLRALIAFLRTQLEHAGAHTRFHRAKGEDALGVTAARRALDRANLPPEAIDLLIYTGVGRGFVEPATANVFQSELGVARATCFDILDACASWLRGVDVASCMIRSGRYRTAMLLNCEFNFQEYEPSSVTSQGELDELWAGYTVGEAATAAVLTDDANEAPSHHISFRNLGNQIGLCQIPLPQADQFLNGARRPDRTPWRFYA